jgi:hypothetical protein
MQKPPRDAASMSQATMAARRHDELAATLVDLLGRIEEELAYNAAKGSGPYRQGMHDGLRFAQDALAAVLAEHGVDSGSAAPSMQTTALDA